MFTPEIAKVLDEHGYDTLAQIGKGGFASCFLVFSRKYNMEFACKVMPLQHGNMNSFLQVFQNELVALTNVVHQHIIPIYEFFVSETHIFMILQYCHNGDLFHFVKQNGPIKDATKLLTTLLMMVDALQHLESHNITHNDIKPGNFLIDKYGRIKLTDFGLSGIKHHGEFANDYRGSLYYCSPEIISKKPYDPYKAQIWSFGVTIYYLATGTVPFYAEDIDALKLFVTCGNYKMPKTISPIISELIAKCLKVDPSERVTLDDLREIIEKKLKQPHRQMVASASTLNQCKSSRNAPNRIIKPLTLQKRRISSSRSYIVC